MLRSMYNDKDLKRVARVEHHTEGGPPSRQYLVLLGKDGVIKTKEGQNSVDMFRTRIPEALEYLRWLNKGHFYPFRSAAEHAGTASKIFVFVLNQPK